IPIEIYQEILEYSNYLTQIRLLQVCKYFHDNLKIYIDNLYDSNIKYLHLLSDDIIKNYKHIRKLDASCNEKITNKGIQHLKLHTLNSAWNNNITDDGIEHMTTLHTLHTLGNTITDKGLKNLINLKVMSG